MNPTYDFKIKVHVKRESHELEEEDGAYVSKPGIARWDSKLVEIARRISYFDEGCQKGPHISCLNKRNCQMGFQVDGDRQKGSRISLFGGRQMGPHISALNKRNRQRGFQVDGDRQKGSRISLFWGSPDGTSYSMFVKRNRQMGFQDD
ncbi:hypothetical protein D5086_014297 [Populus alba]|uniref:Uncharacterized protein n=1 Tax=Populus alba TaxID=43335 RepID=A0ACC4BYY2_POPAL